MLYSQQKHPSFIIKLPAASDYAPLSKKSRALATELGISANPLRLAQFSFNLVSSIVSSIIPLAIRATKNSKDREAVREIVAMLNNRFYQARDAYYSSITLGMIQVRQSASGNVGWPLQLIGNTC